MKQALVLFFSLLIISLTVGCAGPKNSVDRFIKVMNDRLEILEKHKDNPPEAALALYKYNAGEEDELGELARELKRQNANYENAEQQAVLNEKLKPVMDRMLALINETPNLFLNEDISKAFEAFDLGF